MGWYTLGFKSYKEPCKIYDNYSKQCSALKGLMCMFIKPSKAVICAISKHIT